MSGPVKFVVPQLGVLALAWVAAETAAAIAVAAAERNQAQERQRQEEQRRLSQLDAWRRDSERARQAEVEDACRRAEQARESEREEALRRAEAQRQRLEEERRRAELSRDADLALASAAAEVAGLCGDPLVAQWQQTEVQGLKSRVDALRAEIEAGRIEGVAEAARAIQSELPAIDESARRYQEAAIRRQYIAKGIAESLTEMGFTVSAQALEHPDHPQSAVIFEGQRVSGAAVAVSVPTEGEVWYSIDGYPMRLEPRASGGETPTCDEAQGEIAAMHAILEERFGIQMGELQWEGKDPQRSVRVADDFDIGGGAAPRRGRQP